MKLRYAKDFGSRAGSAWRLVFIYALMPWMHQYRILGEWTNFQDVIKVEKSNEFDGDAVVMPDSIQQQFPTVEDDTSSMNKRYFEI